MSGASTVFVIDDDLAIRELVEFQLLAAGFAVKSFASALDFLQMDLASLSGCLLTDVRMPEMDGLELQEELNRRGITLPVVIMTANADIPLAVRAMRAGAIDIVEKPFSAGSLRNQIQLALSMARSSSSQKAAHARFQQLTPRETAVLEMIVAGMASKTIAADLGISQRTVEGHRAKIMEKLKVDNVASLVRLALSR